MYKLSFKINIKKLLSKFFLAVIFIFVLQLICSCDNSVKFNFGDNGDIKLDLLNGHTTLYTFYYSNPADDPDTKSSSVRHKIGEVVKGDSFFPKHLKDGYRASWVCFDSKDNKDLSMPSNIQLEEIEGSLFVSSVTVTQRPLEFYAGKWIPRNDTPYKVNHYKQKLGLSDYDVFDKGNYELDETEHLKGTTDDKISFIKKEYLGFEYSSSDLGESNGIITGDGKSEVNIYYDRKQVTVTIDPNGGTFTDSGLDTPMLLTGRYEESVKLPEVKLKNYHITGYLKVETDEEVKTIEKFSADDEVYKVLWAEDLKYKYNVRHLLQKVSAKEPSESDLKYGKAGTLTSGGKTYYTYYTLAKEITLEDFEGEETLAELATSELIPNIDNYVPADDKIKQSIIKADGSTVVDVCYNVKPFEVTLYANGGIGGSVKQTFYTETDCISIMSLENTSFSPMLPMNHYKFDVWNSLANGSGEKYKDENILSFTEENPISLYAQWIEVDKVNYTVRHLLQKVSATVPDASQTVGGRTGTITSAGKTYYTYYTVGKTETKTGFPGDETRAEGAGVMLIANIANYEVKGTAGFADGPIADVEQSEISEDGKTVVDIYYDVKPFEVTMHINVQDGTETAKQTFYTETDCITIMPSADAGFNPPESYEFVSWNTAPGGNGKTYAEESVLAFTKAPGMLFELYAQWKSFAIYVDVTLGSDSDVGTKENPVKTISAALGKIEDKTNPKNAIVLLTNITENISQIDSDLVLTVSSDMGMKKILGTNNFAAQKLKLQNVIASAVTYSGKELILSEDANIETINLSAKNQVILLENYTSSGTTKIVFDAAVKNSYKENYAILKSATSTAIAASQCDKFENDDFGIKYDDETECGILSNVHGGIEDDLFINDFGFALSKNTFECSPLDPKTSASFDVTLDFENIDKIDESCFESISVKIYNGSTEISAIVLPTEDKKGAEVSIAELYAGSYSVIVYSKIKGVLYSQTKQIFVNLSGS